MKIGYDAKRAFENFTGLGNYSRMVIDLVAESIDDIFLFSSKKEPVVNWSIPDNAKVINPNYKLPFWRALGITKQIKSSPIELYHGLSHELPFNIQNANIPTIVTMHDCIFHHFPNSYTWIDQKIYDQKWQNAVRKADKIIAISQSTANDLIRFYDADSKKIEIIHLFASENFTLDCDRDESKITLDKFGLTDEPFLLFVGNHHPRKNLDLVIQTYTQIQAELPPVFIVGGNSKLLHDFIQKHNLTKKIRVPNQAVNHKELAHLYNKATALIYPSLYEGFGLPVLEAMQSGTPVITCHNSSLKEVGGEAVLYTSTDDPDELAHHISNLVNDTNLRDELQRKGLRQAERFTKDIHEEQLLKLYSDLIE